MPVENFVIQKFKNSIDCKGKSWKCNVNDIIMDTKNLTNIVHLNIKTKT